MPRRKIARTDIIYYFDIVKRKDLPRAPKGYEWGVEYIPRRIYTKHYHYVWVKSKVPTDTYVYRKRRVTIKRKKVYKRYRVYLRRVRKYYRRYKTKQVRVWKLHRLKKRRKEHWIPTEERIEGLLKRYKIEKDNFETIEPPYFEHVELNTLFNATKPAIPVINKYDLIFLYYIFRISKPTGQFSVQYNLQGSSFYIGRPKGVYEIVKTELPAAIKTTASRLRRSKKNMTYIATVCFSAVKKRELEEGKQ